MASSNITGTYPLSAWHSLIGRGSCKSVHSRSASHSIAGAALRNPRLRLWNSGQVSHFVFLRALYGDIAAADVLGSSLRCLHLFESAIGATDSRGFSQVRRKTAAILGLAVKMVVSIDGEVPVALLCARVAGTANTALVKAFEIQLLNQWPGRALSGCWDVRRRVPKMKHRGVRMLSVSRWGVRMRVY